MKHLRRKAWRYANATFPERQITVQADGRQQVIVLSPSMQALLAVVGFLLLAWLSFASVNIIFGDRIRAARDRRFEQMQASYESRIADLQLSYDELNGALLRAQDRFAAIVDSFEAKQQALAAIIERKEALQASLPNLKPAAHSRTRSAAALPVPKPKPAVLPPVIGVGGVFDPPTPDSAAAWAPPFARPPSPAEVLPSGKPPAVTPESPPKPANGPGLSQVLSGAAEKLSALFHRKTSVNVDHPILHQAALEEARVASLMARQPPLMEAAAIAMDQDVKDLSRVIRMTGLDASRLINHAPVSAFAAPLPGMSMDEQDGFGATLADAMASLQKFSTLVTAFHALPFDVPVEGAWISSEFGEREDPFNEELAFHSGMDFSAPLGSEVHATAGGVVVFTGPRGAYGNTVEIDHGYGMRTRYGHLAEISVQAGARLENGAVVGKLGSTGRSTGPHVHYEVWSDDTVRDPSKFIKAGRYVHEAQGS